MSNPFAAFRKNQKVWMVGLVLLAILAFVIAPAIQTATNAFTGGGGTGGKEVVVSWVGGKITVADLQNAAQKHNGLVRFLNELANEVIAEQGQPQVPGFAYDPASKTVTQLGIQTSSNEADVCRTRILASHGKRLGIEFSDESADEFIREYCDDRVATARIEEILSDSTGGRLTWFEVRELLKEELTAMVVGQTARAGLYSTAPGKTYRDFVKLTQTAKVEAFPVFVDDYVDQVSGSPSEAEIQAIYDIGMTRAANPNSPEAGFMRRYQAGVEYVEANMQQWIDRAKEELTEEEIRAEYDKRVELGQLKVPVETEPAPSETEPAENSSSEDAATSGEASDSEEAAATGPAEAGTDEPAEVGGDSFQEPEAPKSETDVPAPGGEDQSAITGADVKFVSFLQEQGADSTPPPVVSPPQLQPEAATTKPATGTPATAAPEASSGNDEIATAVPTDGSETPAEPEMRTQTFEEARDSIADSMARDKAIPALDEALTKLLEEVMTPFYGQYRQYKAFMDAELTKDENGDPRVAPPKPDLKRFAEENGLTYNETGLLDGTQLSQLPFGLGNIRQDASGISGSVANVVMNPGLDVFRPLQSSYFDQAALMAGNAPEFLQYLFWKTEEKSAYIPELDEVREEVVDAWKRQKARELTLAAAMELSKKVGGNDEDPWGDALSDTQKSLVIETDPFTWMTRFNEFSMTSNVPKLDAVGGEFMQQVFATPAGQTVVAANGSRNVLYVTRVVEYGPTDEELRDRFNADPIKSGPMGIAREERDRMVVDWYENLEQDLGVQWMMNVGQFN